jgi:RNA 2',3'-cyclic 3'-phosphodiesterase
VATSGQPETRVRCFVAIRPSAEVCERIAAFQAELRREITGHDIRWATLEQIHLTLRFLGDVEARRLEELKQWLAAIAHDEQSFRLEARGLGVFPNARRPTVAWIGLGGELERLSNLQQHVERATAGFGKIEDRPFQPHLTIGRIDENARAGVLLGEKVAENQSRQLGSWPVTEMDLMRSELLPAGPRYTRLAVFGWGSKAG